MLLRLMQASGLCRLDLSALAALDTEPALVLAANHPGLLDAVLVTACVRRTVRISRATLWNPFLGGGMRLAEGEVKRFVAELEQYFRDELWRGELQPEIARMHQAA